MRRNEMSGYLDAIGIDAAMRAQIAEQLTEEKAAAA